MNFIPKRFVLPFRAFHTTSFLLLILLLCNAVILRAQPKFLAESSGLSGFNFCDFASFALLFALAEIFLSLGGFLGSAFFTLILSIALFEVFYLALKLKIVFDNVLLAFTDLTSLSDYRLEFILLFGFSIAGGYLLRKSLKPNFKALFGWLFFFCFFAIISLFSGSHSALDKRDFLPFLNKKMPISEAARKLQNNNDLFLEKEFPHKLREAWGGLIGDCGFIIANLLSPSPHHIHGQKAFFPTELEPAIPPHPTLKTILLIMGESSNPSHYSVYHSKSNTTPFLLNLERKGLACHLSQAHSPANLTRNGVLPSISFWHPENMPALAETKNLLELAKDSGFQTYFLSKQIENNDYTAPIGYVLQSSENFISPNEFYGIYHYQEAHHFTGSDFDLLPLLEKALSESFPKKFIGLHIKGNHMPYPARSQKEDELALPNGSWYDRSIHTTDRFLQKTYQKLLENDPNGLIFYVSDHGEDLQHGGHGIAFGQEQYEIPVIFIGKNARHWCGEAEKFRQKNGWFSSLSNNLLISRMLGFKIKPEAIKKRQERDEVLLPSGKAGIWEEIPIVKNNAYLIEKAPGRASEPFLCEQAIGENYSAGASSVLSSSASIPSSAASAAASSVRF